jgi:hypothetical protein
MIITAILLCLALFAGMLVCLEVGFRIGKRFQQAAGGEETGILDGAVFALLGLLLGFAFAGAVERFGHRRDLIIEEVNAIGTAYLRIDLLEATDQPPFRTLFSDYITARVNLYDVLDKGGDPEPTFKTIAQLQKKIWGAAIAGVSKTSKQDTAEVVLPALNEMFDIATERKVLLGVHTPQLILGLLMAVSLLSALLAGNGMARPGKRHTWHGAIFAAAVSLTIYAILDLDHPRAGVIRLDSADKAFRDLQTSL